MGSLASLVARLAATGVNQTDICRESYYAYHVSVKGIAWRNLFTAYLCRMFPCILE